MVPLMRAGFELEHNEFLLVPIYFLCTYYVICIIRSAENGKERHLELIRMLDLH